MAAARSINDTIKEIKDLIEKLFPDDSLDTEHNTQYSSGYSLDGVLYDLKRFEAEKLIPLEDRTFVPHEEFKRTCEMIKYWIPFGGYYYFRCVSRRCELRPRLKCYGVPSNHIMTYRLEDGNEFMSH